MHFNSLLFWATIIGKVQELGDVLFHQKRKMITHNRTSYTKMSWTGAFSAIKCNYTICLYIPLYSYQISLFTHARTVALNVLNIGQRLVLQQSRKITTKRRNLGGRRQRMSRLCLLEVQELQDQCYRFMRLKNRIIYLTFPSFIPEFEQAHFWFLSSNSRRAETTELNSAEMLFLPKYFASYARSDFFFARWQKFGSALILFDGRT